MSAVQGLLRRALATLLRWPDYMRYQGKEREDLWTGEPLGDGSARVADALERARLNALLDAEGQPAKLDAEWLAAQTQIRQTWSG